MARSTLAAAGLFALSLPFLVPGSPAAASSPTAAGVWEQIDPDTGRVGAYVTIEEHDGVYQGTMTKLFLKPEENQNPTCDDCKGDQKGHPFLGLRLMDHLVRHGLKYEDGTIVDPRNGSEYSLELTLSPDGQTLTVRGFMGISLLGSSQEWKRLPEQTDQSSSQ